MDLDPVAIFRSISDGELSRALALSALLSWAASQIKPYLPTGAATVARDAQGIPVEPVENRWLPLVVLVLNLALNPLIAWAINVGGQGAQQSVLASAFYGFVFAFASIGAARAIKLTTKGDQAEKKVTQLQSIAPPSSQAP